MAEAAQERIPQRVQELGPAPERLAAFLRAEHPRDTAKHVQTRVEATGAVCSEDRAKKWVAAIAFPDWPQQQALMIAYGKAFNAAVWGPAILTHEEREALAIEQEQHRLHQRAERLASSRANRRAYLGLA